MDSSWGIGGVVLVIFIFLLIIIAIAVWCGGWGCGDNDDCGPEGCKVPKKCHKKKKPCCNLLPDPVILNASHLDSEETQVLAAATTTPIEFKSTDLNRGGWTVDVTGAIWTAPAAGTYSVAYALNFQVVSDNPIETISRLVINGTPLAYSQGWTQVSGSVSENVKSQANITLAIGDTVQVQTENTNATLTTAVIQATLSINRIATS